jgi:hypothetical protein
MDSTGWLITATFAGPILGALAATGLITALLSAARARAQRVKHVPVSGTDLYGYGVPLTEPQFRELYAAMNAELDELPPPAERNEWQLKRQYAAINRFSVFTGTYPKAFPMLGNADQAWEWYAANNGYATGADPDNPWTLEGLWGNG